MTISTCVAGLVAEGRIKKSQGEKVERYYDAHYQALKGQMGELPAAEMASERAIKQMQGEIDLSKMRAAQAIAVQSRIHAELHAFNEGKGGYAEGTLGAAVDKSKRLIGGRDKAKGPAEGGPIHPDALPALLGGNDARHAGGTLEGKHLAVQAQMDSMMRGVVLKHGADAIGRLRDPAGLADLGREAFGEKSGNSHAAELAKAWEAAREWARARANAAGASIGKLADYGLQMHWDSAKVRLLASFDKFREIVLPELNRARMIDWETGAPFSDAKLDEVMEKVWQGIRSNGWDDREPGGLGKPGMVNDGSDPRFFMFKDFDSWNRVNDQLGNGNAFTSMNGMLEGRARQIAALEMLGPNPDHMIKWAQDLVEKSAQTDSASDTAAIDRARAANRTAGRIWQEFKGDLNLPESKRISNFFGTWRNVKAAAALGSALKAQQTDLVLNHTARAYNGLPQWGMAKMWLDMFKPSLRDDREFAARQMMGLAEQRHFTAVQSQLFGRDFAAPLSRRLSSANMTLSGSARWAQLGRNSLGKSWWGAITSARATPWGELDPTFRAAMARGGFAEGDWDALRATPIEDVHGSKWIMADNVADENLRLKAAEMILRQANTVLPVPDLRARAAMNLIPRLGGIPGVITEMLKSPFMFKQFGVSILLTQMSRMMTMPAGSAARYAARFAIGATLLGALELQVGHLFHGEEMEDPTTGKFWGWAALYGGTGGIFADFLREAMQDPDKGIVGFAAGPMVEDLQRAFSVGLRKGQHGHMVELNPNWRGAAYKLARSDMPGGSLWYARLAFDRMIGDELQQAIDPHYQHSWAITAHGARARRSPMFAPPGSGFPGLMGPQPGHAPAHAPDMGRAIGEPEGARP
jgi:hypothetical protein